MSEKEVLNDGRGTGITASGAELGGGPNPQQPSGAAKAGHIDPSNPSGTGLDTGLAGSGGGLAAADKQYPGNNRSSNRNPSRNNGTANGAAGGNGAAAGDQPAAAKETGIPQKSSDLKPKDIKPSKAKTTAKEKAKGPANYTITDTGTIATILQAGMALVAGLTRRDYWNLSEDEAEAIAGPAAVMLQKLDSKTKKIMEKATAPIMLGSAIAGVMLPKVLMDMQSRGGVKNAARQIVPSVTGVIDPASQKPAYGHEGDPANAPAPTLTNNSEVTELFKSLDNGAAAGTLKV